MPAHDVDRRNPATAIGLWQEELETFRRDLHAHPELGFQETRTAELVARKLTTFGIEVHRGLARTGIVGVIRGRQQSSGRAIGLRADLDCLPIAETGALPWRSKHAGRMHACGHDGHTTMLLACARHLSETRDFNGTAYVIFQPAEEAGGGGRVMVEEGLFERFPVDEIYALHNWPALPAGKLAVRAGPVMAATDEFQITVHGRGGHAAMPHLTIDPVLASAHVISALQSIASRGVSPVDSVVVSVCSMQTSQLSASNIIPDNVRLIGTLRSFRPETRAFALKRVEEIARSIAGGFGASVEFVLNPGYPATINSREQAEFAARVAAGIFGEDNVVTDADPTMGGEDFSYMLQERPGAYAWIGQGGGPSGCFLHNPGYDFNDAILPLGAGFLAALIEEGLPLE
jgi:amidohydrolase